MQNGINTNNEILSKIGKCEILVKSSNYIQCIIENVFCEFQIDYVEKKWYQFKTTGRSNSPKESFIKWID